MCGKLGLGLDSLDGGEIEYVGWASSWKCSGNIDLHIGFWCYVDIIYGLCCF